MTLDEQTDDLIARLTSARNDGLPPKAMDGLLAEAIEGLLTEKAARAASRLAARGLSAISIADLRTAIDEALDRRLAT